MPRPSEDSYFGGKKGAAGKAHTAFVSQYGLSKGEQVYQSYIQKRKAMGRARRRTGA